MTASELLVRCGHDLFGEGIHWKSQMAQFLEVKIDTVDAMSKGKSRVPPGVWSEIDTEVRRRQAALLNLLDALIDR